MKKRPPALSSPEFRSIVQQNKWRLNVKPPNTPLMLTGISIFPAAPQWQRAFLFIPKQYKAPRIMVLQLGQRSALAPRSPPIDGFKDRPASSDQIH